MSRNSINQSPNTFFNGSNSNSYITTRINNRTPSPVSNSRKYVPYSQKIDYQEYENLAKSIIEKLRFRGFDSVIFDFDGTLTKCHTARQSSFTDELAAENWFAEKELLETILEKGKSEEIEFYIASRQTEEILRMILRAHNLEGYFTEIHGSSENKEIAIKGIAAKHQKVLYLDDYAEDVSDLSNVTLVRGLLEKLSHSDKMIGEDLEGKAGLDYGKWKKLLDCLVRDIYNLTPRRLDVMQEFDGSNSSFSSIIRKPSGSFSSIFKNERKVVGGIFASKLTTGLGPELNDESNRGDFLTRQLPGSQSVFGDYEKIEVGTNVDKSEARKPAKINNSPGR